MKTEFLPEAEQKTLFYLERTIEGGLQTFVEVGNALLEIREKRLYRMEYRTFEDYCRGRWGMARNYANKMIAAAEVVNGLGTIVPILPATESQARPLTRLEPELQREAWSEAVATAPNGKPTAAHVESVVRRFVSPEPPQTPVADDTDEYLEQLADDPDGYEWSDETPSSAYCKYCYETHGDWEFEYNDGPSWVCLRCDHRTKGDLVSEPPPTKLPLTASNHKPSETPGYDGDEWYTPAEYIEAARRVLPGGIDLDPASCQEANRVVKARQFFSKDDDGLSRTWHGSVWLNPPYSSPLIQHFIDKLIAEYEQCNVSAAIVLVNNCTDTGWFHRLVSRHPVCFPRGRVQFWRRDSDTQSARQGQAIFYLGKDLDLFVHEFSKFGVVMEKIANVDPK